MDGTGQDESQVARGVHLGVQLAQSIFLHQSRQYADVASRDLTNATSTGANAVVDASNKICLGDGLLKGSGCVRIKEKIRVQLLAETRPTNVYDRSK